MGYANVGVCCERPGCLDVASNASFLVLWCFGRPSIVPRLGRVAHSSGERLSSRRPTRNHNSTPASRDARLRPAAPLPTVHARKALLFVRRSRAPGRRRRALHRRPFGPLRAPRSGPLHRIRSRSSRWCPCQRASARCQPDVARGRPLREDRARRRDQGPPRAFGGDAGLLHALRPAGHRQGSRDGQGRCPQGHRDGAEGAGERRLWARREQGFAAGAGLLARGLQGPSDQGPRRQGVYWPRAAVSEGARRVVQGPRAERREGPQRVRPAGCRRRRLCRGEGEGAALHVRRGVAARLSPVRPRGRHTGGPSFGGGVRSLWASRGLWLAEPRGPRHGRRSVAQHGSFDHKRLQGPALGSQEGQRVLVQGLRLWPRRGGPQHRQKLPRRERAPPRRGQVAGMDAEAARGTEQGRGHRRAADGPRGTGPRSRERVGAARLREASAGQGHWCPRGAGREGAPGRPGRAVRGSVPRLRLNDRLGQRQGSPWHDDGSRRARDSGQGVDRPRGHRRGLESRRHAAGMHVVDAPRRGHRSQEDGTESWSRSSNANSPRNPSATGAGSWATI